jgi:hypothetical protein
MLREAEGLVAGIACWARGSGCVAGSGGMRGERDDGAVGETGAFAE